MYINRRRIELHGRPTEIAQIKSKKKEDAAIDVQKTIAQVKSKKVEDVAIDRSKCNKRFDNEELIESAETGKEESDTFVEVGTRQVVEALLVNEDREGDGEETNSFVEVNTCRVVEELEKENQDNNEGGRSEASKLMSINRYGRDLGADESTKEKIQLIKNREEDEDSNENNTEIETKTINNATKPDIETKTETGVETAIEFNVIGIDVDSSFELIEKSDVKDRGGILIDKKCGPFRATERGRLSRAIHVLKRHRKKVKDESMVEMKSIRM